MEILPGKSFMHSFKINIYLVVYFFILILFAIFFLYKKHDVGNDSTIAEWIINYSGGFTKRGLIGDISIIFSNLFSYNLRDIIFVFQVGNEIQ